MNDIHNLEAARLVYPFVATPPVGTESRQPSVAQSRASTSTDSLSNDAVEISDAGAELAATTEAPPIRFDKVAEIRDALAKGVYDVDSKLSSVVDRIIKEL